MQSNKKHVLVRAAAILAAGAMLLTAGLTAGAAGEVPDDPIRGGEAADLSVDPTGESSGYSAVLYDNTNGLPTSEANAVAQTADGFIWIGSYSGLIRYDGNTFERIDSTTGIVSVVSLFVDSQDRLWIGTNDNGVAVMEDGNFRLFQKKDGLTSSSVRAVSEDEEGNIYIATTQGIAIVKPDMTLETLDEDQIGQAFILDLRRGADNALYGITREGAVFSMRGGRVTGFYDGEKIGISGIHALLPDMDNPGYIYVGTEHSEIYYGNLENSMQDVQRIDVSPLSYINSIAHIDDTVWVCADNGIGFADSKGFRQIEELTFNSAAEKMMTDYQGNLWFNSSKQGVMKIVPNQFEDLFQRYDLDAAVINSTCLYHDRLFLGGSNTGLTILSLHGATKHLPLKSARTASGKALDWKDLGNELDGVRIRSIVKDSQDHLWISTYGETALIRFKGDEAVRFGQEDGMPSDRIRTVYERADGSIMAACTGGLVLIEGDEVREVYDAGSGISNTEILTVCEASNGDMLAGTDGNGIYVVSGNKVTHLGTEEGLESEVVMRIKKDPQRELYWLVTSNSIAYMDEDYDITTVTNFPYSNNFDLYENSSGDMWVLSSNGIYVVPTEELINNEEGMSPQFYSRYNGLPCITTANSYSELTPEGTLYISGTTGAAKVNIESRIEDLQDIRIGVPFIEADGKYLYPGEDGSFILDPNVRKVTIHSFVFNYALSNPQVTTYLEGFDTAAATILRSEMKPIDYTNLRGGTYHFHISLTDEMGESMNALNITIIKRRALHEMLWFRALLIAAGILLIVGIVVIVIRRRTAVFLRKQEEDKILIHEIVETFAKVIDMKDRYTNGHSIRVANYTAMLAKELGLDEDTIEKYRNIALLHDIGKVGVPESVLNKAGKLTDEEFAKIKSHTSLGFETLHNISIMPELAIGAEAHHERPDGKGYPKGLKGDEIPRVAQIIAVADCFDAMYSDRPYRKRMNFDKAVSIIKEAAGTQLTADVVEAFLRLVEQGEFRAADDTGGGTTENIDNIHKRFEKESAEAAKETEKE